MSMGLSDGRLIQEYTMARRKATTVESTETFEAPVEEFTEVDVVVPVDDEVEEVVDTEETKSEDKPAKAPAAPKRGDLDEGYVTPVQFAKELSKPLDGNPDNLEESNWRYTHSKTGAHVVAPQMVYSYLKSASSGLEIRNGVIDSNGVERNNVLKLDEALAWWDGKKLKAAERTEAAKAKALAKASKADDKTTSETDQDVAPSVSVEEAE